MFPCGFARQSRWPPGAGRLPPQAGYRPRLQPPALAPADPAPALVGGDLGAVLEVQLFQNAVDVVLDGARRNEEALRYLLVAGPLAGQLQHLDFARREIGAGLAYLGVAVRLANEGVQNALRHRRGDNGFSPQRALQHLEQFVGLHILHQVAVGAAADRLEQVLLVLGHREHDDLGVRQLRLYEARGLDAVAAGHPDVHENDVWLQPAGLLHALPAVACLFDDRALPALDDKAAADALSPLPHGLQTEPAALGDARGIEPGSVVSHDDADLPVAGLDLQPHFGARGVLAHVGQGFLDDAHKLHLAVRRQDSRGAAVALEVTRYAGALAERLYVFAQSAAQTGLGERGTQVHDGAADILVRFAGHGGHRFQFCLRPVRIAAGEEAVHDAQLHIQVAQRLGQAVVDLAGHPLALLEHRDGAGLAEHLGVLKDGAHLGGEGAQQGHLAGIERAQLAADNEDDADVVPLGPYGGTNAGPGGPAAQYALATRHRVGVREDHRLSQRHRLLALARHQGRAAVRQGDALMQPALGHELQFAVFFRHQGDACP